jgi:hypothetical protein
MKRSTQQEVPTLPDPYDLDGGVPKGVAIEQTLVGMGKCRAVCGERVQGRSGDFPGGKVCVMEDRGSWSLMRGGPPCARQLRKDVLGDAPSLSF